MRRVGKERLGRTCWNQFVGTSLCLSRPVQFVHVVWRQRIRASRRSLQQRNGQEQLAKETRSMIFASILGQCVKQHLMRLSDEDEATLWTKGGAPIPQGCRVESSACCRLVFLVLSETLAGQRRVFAASSSRGAGAETGVCMRRLLLARSVPEHQEGLGRGIPGAADVGVGMRKSASWCCSGRWAVRTGLSPGI